MTKLPERYRLGDKIGEGAMGEVYQAYDTHTERDVAIKVLPSNSLKGPRRARFQREARTIARLEHPFVVPLYDFHLPEDPEEQPFLVMRYMTGGTLADKIRRGRLPKEEVVQITRRIGQALDAAHKRNLVHRDIKPGNILLDDDGYAYLADFGIVKDSEAHDSLTGEGQPGTAPYMSPEQIKGEELDGRSDIYALGVVVFEMLTGALPFGGNLGMIFQGHLYEPVPSVFSFVSDLPDEVDELLRKAMAKNPEERFRKAEHLAHLLEAALQSPTAYMTSRDALVRAMEESFDANPGTAVGLSAAPENNQAVSETARSPVMAETVETTTSRRWQYVAGGLGVGLVVVIALFISRLAAEREPVNQTAVSPESLRANVVASVSPELVMAQSTPTELIDPTSSPEFIVVLQQADSAIWQIGDELQRIPENGRVPYQLPLMFQSSNEPVRLLLPNLVSIILDTNSTVWIEAATQDEDETVLRLVQGRLLIEAQTAFVRVYHEAGLQAELEGGLFGVAYDEANEEWAVDCLAGLCQLGQEEADKPFALAEGHYSVILPDTVITTPSPARFDMYTNLAQTIPEPTDTPTAAPTETPSATPTSATTRTPLPTFIPGSRGPETIVIGQSSDGKDIVAVRMGNGPQTLLLVGGIHSGYAPNSVQLAEQLAAHFAQNLTFIPNNVTIYLVTNLNPDAAAAPGELAGRLNANGVDLNRNWDCRWDPDPAVLGEVREGAGGTAVLSEPETAALNSFIAQIQPDAAVFWGAGRRANGVVSPGACEERSLVSRELVHYYAIAAGYDFLNRPEILADPALTGDVTNWLDKIGIPTIYVILPDFLEVNFEREWAGVLSVISAVSVPARLQQTPTPEICQQPVNPAWTGLYEANRLQLGCPISGVNQPMSVWQPFANGRMLWRQDTDQVYVLYDDFSLETFVVDSPNLAGFQVSELVKGAIGYVYDTYSAVSSKIGPPEDQEQQAADVMIQEFSHGFIISWQDNGPQTNLIFLGANQWQSP
ncbi:MAG: protein kinase [Anaerolineaceae bacterium]|nr:protein kinase [Anaerolineaceae bacterium]